MVSASDALIEYADLILNSIEELKILEYNKKGRKYRFVNNNFQRIREEDKHLIINPDDLSQKLGLISSFCILYNIDEGGMFELYPDFCLSIIGVAHELEQNQWYEEENSSVIHIKHAKYNPLIIQDLAFDFVEKNPITPKHIEMGLNLLVCSKLNFLHTDHHIGINVEGRYMKYFIKEYYGEQLLSSPEVLVALKSFVHWGNIKGILHKLNVPNINLSESQLKNFSNFPDPVEELKLSVYDRYPSGTSKYSLIRKSVDILGEWKYSKLIPYPKSDQFDLNWLYELCHDIEKDPIKYHLRSSSKNLSNNPVNLGELNSRFSTKIASLLTYISIVFNIFETTGGFLLQNSKIPKLTSKLIDENLEFYNQLLKIQENISTYESKGWESDDIIVRLSSNTGNNSLFDEVMRMREIYIDDYE
jgi:hypothetical protein